MTPNLLSETASSPQGFELEAGLEYAMVTFEISEMENMSKPTFQTPLWTEELEPSPLRALSPLSSEEDIISLALGAPDESLVPKEDFSEALRWTTRDLTEISRLTPPSEKLKRQIVSICELRGLQCTPDQIILTSGAQQALNLLARFFLSPFQTVLLENLTYIGIHQVIRPFSSRLLPVNTSPTTGIDTTEIHRFLAKGERPSFIYTIPSGHNPLGYTTPTRKLDELIELANYYQTPIIEDDPYGLLYYDDKEPVALRSRETDLVFYVGSLSKILTPSLRLGWIVAPKGTETRLSSIKDMEDLDCASLSQHVAERLLAQGHLKSHLNFLRTEYQHRRNAMASALSEHFGDLASWTTPQCGFFFWLTFHSNVSIQRLLNSCLTRYRVAFAPGLTFCPSHPNHAATASRSLRLSFSRYSASLLTEGIRRLSLACREELRLKETS